jgi:hypothetical protein
MNKLILIAVLLFTVTGCARKTKVTIEQKPAHEPIVRTVKADQYRITSPFGHEFTVDVTRFPKEDHGYNNTCKINYIITNSGGKDFRHRELFNASGSKIAKSGEPSIVFEFTTSDGKKIEKTQSIYFDISSGRSSEVYTMSIDVGLGTCEGEVKPVCIQYEEQL